MSRLRNKLASTSVSSLSDDILWKLIQCYNDKYLEMAKSSSALQQLDSEHQDEFLKYYLPDHLDMVRSTSEFDFLFEKLDNAITELCQDNFEDSLDIIINDYISDRKLNN